MQDTGTPFSDRRIEFSKYVTYIQVKRRVVKEACVLPFSCQRVDFSNEVFKGFPWLYHTNQVRLMWLRVVRRLVYLYPKEIFMLALISLKAIIIRGDKQDTGRDFHNFHAGALISPMRFICVFPCLHRTNKDRWMLLRHVDFSKSYHFVWWYL